MERPQLPPQLQELLDAKPEPANDDAQPEAANPPYDIPPQPAANANTTASNAANSPQPAGGKQPPKRKRGSQFFGIALIVVGAAALVNWVNPDLLRDSYDLLGATAIGAAIAALGLFFIIRQLVPRQGATYKIGRLTTGAALIWAGAGIAMPDSLPEGWLNAGRSMWPVLLIGYGLEYVWRKSGSRKAKLDFAGLFLLLLVMAVATGAMYSRVLPLIGQNGNYAVTDTPTVVAADRTDKLVVIGNVGNIKLVPSTDGNITVTPTYRSWKKQSLEALKEAAPVRVAAGENEIRAAVQGGDYKTNTRLFDRSTAAVDLLIAAPADIQLDSRTEIGSIEVNGFTNVKSLHASIGAIKLNDSQGDVQVSLSIGDIEVNRFSGKIEASNSLGRVAVQGEPTANWTLSSEIGLVQAKVPPSSDYRFDLSASIGNKTMPELIAGGNESGLHPQLKLSTSIGSAEAYYE
ncbi:MAG: hypothetical protein J7639_21725 [Paenibacillaceae bacterium]|nr:hypothetical protein [Paenibacillaceae bacterium]